jgi:hypothetical protein
MTESLLAERFWRVGFRFREVKGGWGDIFTMTISTVSALANRFDDWRKAFPAKEETRHLAQAELAQHRPGRKIEDFQVQDVHASIPPSAC